MRPAFVVSAARSGSTLLRYLLDSHPEVASPPELNITSLLQIGSELWRQAEAATAPQAARPSSADAGLSDTVCRNARRPLDALMRHYADAAGATVFCDKSLVTVDHLPTIVQCYPDAAYIILYRYPLDMIASGLEASKWGYNAFGFAPFVQRTPANFIAGLASYWIDRASKMLAFEREHPDLASIRVYYEALCDDPADTLARVFELLQVAPDPDVLTRVFEGEHGEGPGDYKIDFTGSINVTSIGRGATLPDTMAPVQVERIDEILAELDYPSLAAGRRGQLAALLGLRHASQLGAGVDELLSTITAALTRRSVDELGDGFRRFFPLALVLRTGAIDPSVLVIDGDGVRLLEGAAGSVNGGSAHRVRATGDVLLRVIEGKMPFAQAVHERHIVVEQHETSGEDPQRELPRRVLAALAALIRG